MQIASFDYTTASGDVSKRDVLVVSEPTSVVFGIDISELNPDDMSEFLEDYRKVFDAKQRELAEVMAKYGLANRFRRFTPEGMSTLATIFVEIVLATTRLSSKNCRCSLVK